MSVDAPSQEVESGVDFGYLRSDCSVREDNYERRERANSTSSMLRDKKSVGRGSVIQEEDESDDLSQRIKSSNLNSFNSNPQIQQ